MKYLEWLSVQEARVANRFAIENTSTPSKPHVSESAEADLKDIFATIQLLASALGFPVFDRLAKGPKKNLVFCKGKDASGKGQYTEDGLVVFKDSLCRAKATAAVRPTTLAAIEAMKQDGVLEVEGSQLRFTQDYAFPSPSAAAVVILGRSANGWTEWQFADGRTLDAGVRQNLGEG